MLVVGGLLVMGPVWAVYFTNDLLLQKSVGPGVIVAVGIVSLASCTAGLVLLIVAVIYSIGKKPDGHISRPDEPRGSPPRSGE
jgi:hypothetical protein